MTSLLFAPAFVLAHSVVSPSQTATSKYENFSLSVPTERDVPTIGITLAIPDGLDHVTPVVKAGWMIKTTKDSEGKVTEISWTGGSVPAGQKDFFVFSARTPATSTTLVWKAYQTYRGGEVVAWDRDPSKPDEGKTKVDYPYSKTEVATETSSPKSSSNSTPTVMATAALAISICALVLAMQKRGHEH